MKQNPSREKTLAETQEGFGNIDPFIVTSPHVLPVTLVPSFLSLLVILLKVSFYLSLMGAQGGQGNKKCLLNLLLHILLYILLVQKMTRDRR